MIDAKKKKVATILAAGARTLFPALLPLFTLLETFGDPDKRKTERGGSGREQTRRKGKTNLKRKQKGQKRRSKSRVFRVRVGLPKLLQDS